MAVYNLVYFSKATREFSRQELKELGEFAEANNRACGITGILLYGMGCFVQLLEGDRNAVQWVYDSIRKDQRHENVVVLSQGKFGKRLFPRWAMGVVNLDTGLADGMLKEATHISEFMTLMTQGQCAGANADRVLKYFRQRLAGKPVNQARLARSA